ncbi:unnamed protein product [Lupinus luteus]|uniref:Uncharacterized protein n=1 Tax=Lupinus luteus TaxID=3873 RepID=A0AAV1Y0L9_LUPLU
MEKHKDVNHSLQTHSSLIRRLSQERELEGHLGCVNAVAWNSKGSLLISGSDDTRINIWNYSDRKLLHSIDTGHSANIFCTKFVPETSDELVVSGAGDAEVENGNPNVVWSASEDGTLRQHDFREGTSCPPAGSSHQECRNVLLDLRSGAKRSLADPPKQVLALKSCDISTTRPHLLLVGGRDVAIVTVEVAAMDRGHPNVHLTHVAFSPDGYEVLLSYSGEHVYLMDVNHAGVNEMQYTSGDVSKLMTYSPTTDRIKLQPFVSNAFPNGFPIKKNIAEKRKWKNDAYMAIRDCYAARKIDNSSYKPLYYMSEALSQLHRHKEALDFAVASHILAPSISEVSERVENVKKDIASAEFEKSIKANHGSSMFHTRGGRILSLNDMLYRSEANSDASQDGPISERDDSDYDEELELDFETSISGDEGHDDESNILHGSLNLRIHQRDDSGENASANGLCESPSSSSQNNGACYQRFVGHCNVGTDIKQASFLGQRGEYVASGSDDGRWFIWEKKTGRLIKMLNGDESGNIVFPKVLIWTPNAPRPSSVAGGSAGPETADVLTAMENNQEKLSLSRDTILPFELLEPLRMHDFPDGALRLRPFECAQS